MLTPLFSFGWNFVALVALVANVTDVAVVIF
jgi:hypothetical protein